VIDRHKMAKHFDVRITDDALSWRRNNAGIAAEARLDGLYVIRTSVPAAAMTTEQAVGAYKALARVERAFRSLKTVDLEIRPVYTTGSPRGCMCSCACWPTMWSSTCAGAWRRCCSTSTTMRRPKRSGCRSWRRPNAHRRRGARQPPGGPKTTGAAQLPQPAARPHHPHAEQDHCAGQSELHLQPAHEANAAAGPGLRAARSEPLIVASRDPTSQLL
jgi:hypothetical protein